jgi:hypothetical protein
MPLDAVFLTPNSRIAAISAAPLPNATSGP